jgi:hypothetical protein
MMWCELLTLYADVYLTITGKDTSDRMREAVVRNSVEEDVDTEKLGKENSQIFFMPWISQK